MDVSVNGNEILIKTSDNKKIEETIALIEDHCQLTDSRINLVLDELREIRSLLVDFNRMFYSSRVDEILAKQILDKKEK